jgi:hypothetical protein
MLCAPQALFIPVSEAWTIGFAESKTPLRLTFSSPRLCVNQSNARPITNPPGNRDWP